jgi:acetyltransferase-like isoleucine patch superfamily enzyme
LFLDAPISIGDRSYLNRRTEITCKCSVRIGADCAISWEVPVTESAYHLVRYGADLGGVHRRSRMDRRRQHCVDGVTIGAGAVIAAGSLVIGDTAPAALVAGCPAKVVRSDVEWQ